MSPEKPAPSPDQYRVSSDESTTEKLRYKVTSDDYDSLPYTQDEPTVDEAEIKTLPVEKQAQQTTEREIFHPSASEAIVDFFGDYFESEAARPKGYNYEIGADAGLYADNATKEPVSFADPKSSLETIHNSIQGYIARHADELDDLHDLDRRIHNNLIRPILDRVHAAQETGSVRPETIDAFLELLSHGFVDRIARTIYYNAYAEAPTTREEHLTMNELTPSVRGVIQAASKNVSTADQSATFVYFKPTEPHSKTTDRMYIAIDGQKSPAQALQHWFDAIDSQAMWGKLYFKVVDSASERRDSIVVYINDETTDTDGLERVVQEFRSTCPPSLLAEAPPTGVSLGNGMSYGVEYTDLSLISTLMKESSGHSYGTLISAFSHTAMQLAYGECYRQTKNETDKVRFSAVRESAKKYFRELMMCADINPDTMVPNSRGGELPEWANQLQKAV